MVETAEGIGGQKWSFEPEECHAAGIGAFTILHLNRGAVRLAALTERGEAVKHLLVTAPQLWQAANDVIVAERAFIVKDTNENSNRCVLAITALAKMVAKAVGKQDWNDVLQG